MPRLVKSRQDGMSLIEVLIALLILFISLMGSAAMQLNALKHTASALISTQDNFIAYSRLDQMRAEVVHPLSSGHAGAGSS
ncbi:type IV pilus modification protein PilV [Pseudomonas fragi]|uniref:type IV pilus modification protein PilV n=1 Tax=Pseudomonas fragi TaxID=296 RepID=UPI000BA201CE|nr:type IV pilus modification protein PilV [Pseudomonas fragi]PAA43012.1 type IV pilus modification protein PilV [Pseudomonas fragi]